MVSFHYEAVKFFRAALTFDILMGRETDGAERQGRSNEVYVGGNWQNGGRLAIVLEYLASHNLALLWHSLSNSG